MNYLQQLSDKVNSYKTYNQTVKDRVLKQFENISELTEQQYKTALKKLPIVMKANKTFITNYNNCKKQVYRLEIHAFAPELNALHFVGGNIIKTPQKTTINEAIEYLVYKGINFK
jgi:hypothetical protein